MSISKILCIFKTLFFSIAEIDLNTRVYDIPWLSFVPAATDQNQSFRGTLKIAYLRKQKQKQKRK